VKARKPRCIPPKSGLGIGVVSARDLQPLASMTSLETRVARMVTWAIVAMTPLLGVTVYREFASGRGDPVLAAQSLTHVLTIGLLLTFRNPKFVAGATVVYAQITVFAILVHYGPNMNVAAAVIAGALLTQLFFGRSWAVIFLMSWVAIFALAVGLVTATGWPHFSSIVNDFSKPQVWWRILINSSVVITATVVLVGYVIGDLRRSIRVSAEALDRERRERQEREAAVEARRAAETAMANAQRHEIVARIAASAAHDLNNVLTAIMGSAEIAEVDADDPESVRQEVQQIQTSSLRASALTRQLLTFTRQQATRRQPIHLGETLDVTRAMLRRLLPADVHLSVDIEPRLPSVFADPAQIEQVLLNLGVNARDAMPRGGHLYISTFVDPESKDVILEVRDDGEGMTDDVQAKMFEPYFTTKPSGRGTGLGLATVRTIIEQHDGRVEVSSAIGRGTTFRVFLPPTEELAESAEETGNFKTLWYEGTALVADDDPAILRVAAKTLEGCGFTVVTASSGDEALEQARKRDFDLAIVDAIMPGLSGARLVTAIERLSPHARIICSTAYDAGVFGPSFFSREDRDLLPKPYRRRDLIVALQRAFAGPNETRVGGRTRQITTAGAPTKEVTEL